MTTEIATKRRQIALFDLDHTLLPMDSDYAWGHFTTAIGWTDSPQFKQRNEDFYAHYQAGTLDVHAYVRFATQAVRLQGQAKALAARERFMQEIIAPAIRPEALALLQLHRERGDQIVIITATNEFVTRPIATALGVDELIAIELELELELERDTATGSSGWLTGEIIGVPSFRAGKVLRFESWLAERHWRRDSVDVTFYTDSINDLPLLEKADHPVATNPDEKLRAVALKRGWRILELFNT